MTQKQLRQVVADILDHKRQLLADLRTDKTGNPQVRELCSRVDAEVVTFTALFDALDGDTALLKTYLPQPLTLFPL